MSRVNRFLAITTTALAALAACTDQTTAPTAVPSSSDISIQSATTPSGAGGVYTMTNGTAGNYVVAFRRQSDGNLTPLAHYSTGGIGTGGTIDPLASQYSIVLDDHNSFLFVVNAGSDDISMFHVSPDASLQFINRVGSGGDMPVSLASHGKVVYVLNAGNNTVSGFRVSDNKQLVAIPGSTRSLLEGASGASTIHFDTEGRWLIVTERVSNRIETFPVLKDALLGSPVATTSHGAVPFGFDVTDLGQPIITEAMGAAPNGAVSSYTVGSNGVLTAVTPSLNAGGAAACWLVLVRGDRLAFVTNSGSNAIASFHVESNGSVTLINAQAANTGAGSIPIDFDVSEGDGYLYALEAGTGNVGAFAVSGATLSALTTVHAGAGSSGLQGLAAW